MSFTSTAVGIIGGIAANYAMGMGGRYIGSGGDLSAETKNAYYGASAGCATSAVSGLYIERTKPGWGALGITMLIFGTFGTLTNIYNAQHAIASLPPAGITTKIIAARRIT